MTVTSGNWRQGSGESEYFALCALCAQSARGKGDKQQVVPASRVSTDLLLARRCFCDAGTSAESTATSTASGGACS